MGTGAPNEAKYIAERYARREDNGRYSFFNPEVLLAAQERQRVIMHVFSRMLGWRDFNGRKLIEVGCGGGGNLLEFLRLGFLPGNVAGIELLDERAAAARNVLPSSVNIQMGDASVVDVGIGTQDVVYQSVVFSSLLDDRFQEALARRMWDWVKPGGGVLWYDFIYNNPANLDVRGVPVKRIRELFPEGELVVKRVTLAPPISRRVCRVFPRAYHLINAVPFLRTHVLCWIGKSR